MRKELKFLTVLIFLLVVFSIGVYAAGRSDGGLSTGGNTNNRSRDDNVTNQTRGGNRTRFEYQQRDCESFNTTLERIRCRLIQGNESIRPRDVTPEACRELEFNNRGRCVAFYATVQTCYKLEGRAKDACFKRAAGLTKAKLENESTTDRPQKARNYAVALLYELQERVEKAYDRGRITSDEATNLVNKITEIKQAILSGKSKREVKPMIQELKQMWRQSIQNEE